MYDLYIRNASVIDGTGMPAFHADVAVKDGKIVMSPDSGQGAKECLDAQGLVLSPGFIDAHCHSDETLGNAECNLSRSSQGITTEATGQCGESVFPVSEDPEKQQLFIGYLPSYFKSKECGFREEFVHFTTFEKYLQYAKKRKCTANYSMLTGHGALRIAAMGFANRKPTKDEMSHMKSLLRESMEHGSRGLSSGLLYAPSCYADEDELVELCKVVAEYDGFYATHLRNEAGKFVEAVQEAINIAERSGCRLNLSHHKVCGSEFWGATEKTIAMLEDAKARGIPVYTDVYPYLATGNYLNICLPSDFFSQGMDAMAAKLRDPAVRAELKPKIQNMDGRYRQCGGFEHIVICSAPSNPECVGKSVAEYARSIGKDEFETYFDLVCANGQAATAAYFSMSDTDLERILLSDLSVICSDSFDIAEGVPVHPRAFGTFPKCLGYYVREKKLMSLERMIHKMTQAPAEFMLLANKGVIRDGYDADLVIFNPDTVCERADFENSHTLSAGIERVIVAGETVYQNGALTGKYPGRFLPYKET